MTVGVRKPLRTYVDLFYDGVNKTTILFSIFFYSEEVCSYTFSLLYFVAVVQMRQIFESTGGSSRWKVPLFSV